MIVLLVKRRNGHFLASYLWVVIEKDTMTRLWAWQKMADKGGDPPSLISPLLDPVCALRGRQSNSSNEEERKALTTNDCIIFHQTMAPARKVYLLERVFHHHIRPNTVINDGSRRIHGCTKTSWREKWQTYTDSYNKLDKLLSSEWDQIQEGHVELQAKKEALQYKMAESLFPIRISWKSMPEERSSACPEEPWLNFKVLCWKTFLVAAGKIRSHGTTTDVSFWMSNLDSFRYIADFLNECKIAPPDNPPRFPITDDEHCESLGHLCQAFGLNAAAQLP
jgi:hypothetical protein